jgi:ribonuclease/clavin/mitogillin
LIPITPAASVLLTRDPGAAEVFLVRRSDRLRFFGGFWAFPGGKVAPEDSLVSVANSSREPITPERSVRYVAAVRELFEETGILLARQHDGAFLDSGLFLRQTRKDLADNRFSFAEFLERQNLQIDAGDFTLVGDITTPAFTTVRFDTTFLLANLPPNQQPEIWPGELDDSRWSTAAEMLHCWAAGQCLVSPPTVMTLQAVEHRTVTDAPAQLAPMLQSFRQGTIHPIFFAPQVQMIPLLTKGLPPSTHTNAYLLGHDPAFLFDPGPEDAGEQQRLFDLLDERARHGLKLRAIILTHHHPDHTGAAQACSARYQVPIWGHPLTAAKLQGKIAFAQTLTDGDRLDLGPCPDGSDSWFLQALHTPGHASGHVAFFEPRYQLLFAGDMVSTLSSVVIAPPDGDLATYLDSLRRLQSLPARLLLPAHGGASSQPRKTLQDCLDHRTKREQQLLDALGAQPRTVAELSPDLYKGTPAAVMPLAELQLLAGLEKLEHEGKVRRQGEGWRLVG